MTLNTICSTICSTLQYEVISRIPKHVAWHYSEKMKISPVRMTSAFSIEEIKRRKNEVIAGVAMLFLLSGIVCPIAEELICRGAIQISAEYVTGSEKIGFLAASIFFSLMHYPNAKDPLEAISQLVDCYFLYGPLRASGGLTASITAHITHNFSALVPYLGQILLVHYGLKTTPISKPI